MYDKPSIFRSRYSGRNSCQTDYEKLKIILKQKNISYISHLWTLALDCGPLVSIARYIGVVSLPSLASLSCNNSKEETVCLVGEKCSLVVKLTAAIVSIQMNILTMAIKKQLQNVVFHLNKSYLKSFSSFTLL